MARSGRAAGQLRPIRFHRRYTMHAEGSVLVEFGNTHVLCTASVEEKVPPFLKGKGRGWVTAEYGMLPRATNTRGNREAASGKQSGRTHEIQRLIGRSLRAVTDVAVLGERQVSIDCDVLQADGGTRCASITGGFVALQLALQGLVSRKKIERLPLTGSVAAISVGMVDGAALCDLDYSEDSRAEVDANIVMAGVDGLVEVQATAEQTPVTKARLDELLVLAEPAMAALREAQTAACS